MKLQKIALVFAFAFGQNMVIAHDAHQAPQPVGAVVKSSCHCGPTEHWLYKVCIKNYMAQYPDAGFTINFDTEGLSENLVQAIELFAADLQFLDADGNLIVPTISAKGNLLLPMSKNADYKLVKAILHDVDTTTILSAQELYQVWTALLQVMKSAQ